MACLRISPSGATGQSSFRRALDPTSKGPSLQAGWALDDGRLEVFADRLGLIPIYCFARDDEFIIADRLLEVAAQLDQPRLDLDAVAGYLTLGFYLGEDTPLEGVRALGPGAALEWSRGKLSHSVPPLPRRSPLRLARGEAAAHFGELFGRAIERRLHPDASVTLSGGRDSRHILLELARRGAPPRAVVIADRPGSNDRQVALQLAERLRIGVTDAGVCAFTWEAERRKNLSNDFLSDENQWYLTVARALAAGVVHDGLGGDVLSNGLYFDRETASLIAEERCEEAATRFIAMSGSWPSYLRCGPEIGRRAIARIAVELRRHSAVPAPLASFLFWNRTRREVALMPARMLPEHVQPSLPFLDDELLSYLLALPFEEFGPAGFHDEAIAARFPEFVDLPYAHKTPAARKARFPRNALAEWRRAAATQSIARAQLAKALVGLVGTWSDKGFTWWWQRLLPLIQLEAELAALGKQLDIGPLVG